MAVTMRTSALTRRRFLAAGVSSTALAAVGIAKPALSRAADRPLITHGVQSGDVSTDAGIVWARADRPSRMLVEVATTDSFRDRSRRRLRRCSAGDRFHRQGADRGSAGRAGHVLSHRGSRTIRSPRFSARRRSGVSAPRRASGATSRSCGRATPPAGWGIDEARGGMRTYATMLKAGPISSFIPATTSMPTARFQPERKLPDGERVEATS